MATQTKTTLPTAGTSTFNTDLQAFLRQEDADRYDDLFISHVVSGGTHGTGASLTQTPASLTAYCGGYYVTETGSITYPDDASHIYVVAHKDTTTAVTNWTRVTGTHYLYRTGTAAEPSLPADCCWLMKVTTASGSVTAVEDRRFSYPYPLHVSTSAPTVNDDASKGFFVGFKWIDTTNDVSYSLLDSTNGAAVWTADSGATFIQDLDGDTKIQVEESSDEDIIRFDVAGTQEMRLDATGLVIQNGGSDVAGDGPLHIGPGLAGAVTASVIADEVIIESDQTEMGVTMLGGTSSIQRIYFGDTNNATRAFIEFNHSTDFLSFNGVTGNELQIRSGGAVYVNGSDSDAIDFHVRGNGTEIFFTDASVGNAGFGSNSLDASALLDLVSTTKGLGLPSQTTTERDAITTPRDGLTVYNSTTDRISLRSNGAWVDLPTTAEVQWTNSGAIDLTNGGANDQTSVTLASGLSDVNEIEIYITGVSTNTNNQAPMIQLGDSGGLETSSYNGVALHEGTGGALSAEIFTSGYLLSPDAPFDAHIVGDFVIELRHMGSNLWTIKSQGNTAGPDFMWAQGDKTLSAALSRVELLTQGGTATFDGGTAYVRYR